jgi:MoaA/NifB/PqqE/SkfB family radical SAM enzyme
MCAKTSAKAETPKDMCMEDFQKILSDLEKVENVVLEGWGESLLHRDLTGIIQAVKKRGARTGFVTCGYGLDKGRIAALLEAGIDFIGFSLAGVTAETHNSIRVGSDFEALYRSIELFTEMSRNVKGRIPRAHIVFLLLKSNLHELPAVIELSQKVGIGEVIVAHIIHVGNEWQDGQRVFGCEGNDDYAQDVLKRAVQTARRLKIALHVPRINPGDIPVCAENPLKNLYISVEGEVSPCVFLYPPLSSPFKRYFCGTKHHVEKVSFGNVFSEPFEEIWNRRAYRDFRASFIERERAYSESMESLLRMEKPSGLYSPEPPGPCKTCHKMLGI